MCPQGICDGPSRSFREKQWMEKGRTRRDLRAGGRGRILTGAWLRLVGSRFNMTGPEEVSHEATEAGQAKGQEVDWRSSLCDSGMNE